MEQKEFKFDEATPLLAFVDKYRNMVVGHTIKAVYVGGCFFTNCNGASSSVFLLLDNICIGIEFLYPSHLTVFTADEGDFSITGEIQNEPEYKTIQFHSRIPGRDDEWIEWCTETPGMNQRITDIIIERYSYEHEDYPNSCRPDGGDYFGWIQFVLEDGTVLNINAEPAEQDGYVDVRLTNLPAYNLVKSELDRDPSDLGERIDNQFADLMNAWNPEPDELAELAMHYMQKCDHEIEKNQLEKKTDFPDTLYTDHLRNIMSYFTSKRINLDYVNASGKSLKKLALEIGDEACNIVLPFIYTNDRLKSYLDRLDRIISDEYETCKLHNRNGFEDITKAYDNLPEEVRKTAYGQKLRDIKLNGLWELEMYYKAIQDYIRLLH